MPNPTTNNGYAAAGTWNPIDNDPLPSQNAPDTEQPNPKQNSTYDVDSRQTDGFTERPPAASDPAYASEGRDPYAVGGSEVQQALNTSDAADPPAIVKSAISHDGSGGSVAIDLRTPFHRIDSAPAALSVTTSNSPPTPAGTQIAIPAATTVTIDGTALSAATGEQIVTVKLVNGNKRYQQMLIEGSIIRTGEPADGSITAAKLDAGFYAPDAVVVVKKGNTDAENGAAFQTAYAAAKQLTPGGNALAADNRAAVIVPPGQYQIASFDLDGEHVDVVAMFPQKGYLPVGWQPTQNISTNSFPGHPTTFYGEAGNDDGVMVQTADDLRLVGFAIHNSDNTLGAQQSHALRIEASDNADSMYLSMTFWKTGATNLKAGGVQSLNDFSGFWQDCLSNAYAFRVEQASSGVAVKATMIDCIAGSYSFGGDGNNDGGVGCFFLRCLGGTECFMGCGTVGADIDSDCLFIECQAADQSFGVGSAVAGTFLRCRAGDFCFGAAHSGVAGSFTGYAEDCVAGAASFGGRRTESTADSTLGGELVRCIVKGACKPWLLAGATIRDCHFEQQADDTDCFVLTDSGSTVVNSTLLVVQGGTGIPINDDESSRDVAASACRMNNAALDSFEQTVPLNLLVQHDAIKSALPDSADGTHLGFPGSPGATLTGSDSKNTTVSEQFAAIVQLPEFYVAEQDLTLRIRTHVTEPPSVSASVDLTAKLIKVSGLGPTDLCLSPAADVQNDESFTDHDFTIDGDASGDELYAGATILFTVTAAAEDDAGGLPQKKIQISGVSLLIPYVGPQAGLGANVTNLVSTPNNVVDDAIA